MFKGERLHKYTLNQYRKQLNIFSGFMGIKTDDMAFIDFG